MSDRKKPAARKATKSRTSPIAQRASITNVVSLVPTLQDQQAECIILAERLLKWAKEGTMRGLVVVSMHDPRAWSRDYQLHTAGLANDNPTLALGALTACQALLECTALEEVGLL